MLTRLLLCKVSMPLFLFKLKKKKKKAAVRSFTYVLGGSQSVIHLLDEVEVGVSL